MPWQENGGIDYYPLFRRDQGASEIAKRIKVASENIIIVSEAQPQSKEFELATNRIKEAERVYFLGFGYYVLNLERLGLLKSKLIDVSRSPILFSAFNTIEIKKSYKHYRGSALGLGTAQIQSIEKKWGIALLDNKINALEFLKEYADLS